MRGGAEHLLQATAGPELLGPVHDLLARLWADEPGVGEQDRIRFETAVAEVAANIAEHGAAAGAERVSLRLSSSPDRIRAVFEDDGAPVETGTERPPADDAERGRGLLLARAAVDRFSYERDGATNRWVLVLGDL
ncbi:ATP-binding protein [Geodermatophilus sp. URMC 61]|uniref:ATP-binding protein n=1 Tax=Geodermatophilus sp. URMC 61 TaxID=3423411 RepID=UPI00406CE6A4